jgi:hypothetical protein
MHNGWRCARCALERHRNPQDGRLVQYRYQVADDQSIWSVVVRACSVFPGVHYVLCAQPAHICGSCGDYVESAKTVCPRGCIVPPLAVPVLRSRM